MLIKKASCGKLVHQLLLSRGCQKKQTSPTIHNTLSSVNSDPCRLCCHNSTEPACTQAQRCVCLCVFLNVNHLSYIIRNHPIITGVCCAFSCSPCGLRDLLHWRDTCDTEMTIKQTQHTHTQRADRRHLVQWRCNSYDAVLALWCQNTQFMSHMRTHTQQQANAHTDIKSEEQLM